MSDWCPTKDFHFSSMATVDLSCHHCLRVTRVTTKSLADKEARHWREAYERLLSSLNDVVERCHLIHGTDPMRDDFMRWLINIRESIGDEQ